MIAFVLRADADKKGGGDVLQIRSTAEALNAKGVVAEVFIGASRELLRARVIHLTNLDRPHDMLAVAEQLSIWDWRGTTYLNTIHHPHRFTQTIARSNRGLAAFKHALRHSIVVDAALGSSRYRQALETAGESSKSWPPILTNSMAQRRLLRIVDACVTLSSLETDSLREDFGYTQRCISIPNGINEEIIAGADSVGNIDRRGIAVVGRIESRKNSVRLAELLRDSKIPATFAGALNPNEKSFGAEFLRIVRSAENLDYAGPLNAQKVGALLRRSRLHVLASRAEVFPLVDLEAIACGCAVLTTSNSLSWQLLGNDAMVFAPDELRTDDILRAYESAPPSELAGEFRKRFSWNAVADHLISEYRARQLL